MKMSMKNQSVRVISTATTYTVRSKEKTVSESERALYMRLSDHPYFVEGLSKVRRNIGIPYNGFADSQRAFEWEHADKFNKKKLWGAIERFIAEFRIKTAFRTDVKFFVYGYALSSKIVQNQLPLPLWLPDFEKEGTIKQVGRHKIGARLIKTGKDIERNKYQFKTSTTYLEITDHTNSRDVSAVMKEVTKRRKDLRPFAVPKPQAQARLAWQLRIKGATNQQVANEINRQFGVHLKPQHIPLYRERYEKTLRQLKSFSRR